MLVLSRELDQRIVIDLRNIDVSKLDDPFITVMLVEVRYKHGSNPRARIGIDADRQITVHREEVFNTIEREKERISNV